MKLDTALSRGMLLSFGSWRRAQGSGGPDVVRNEAWSFYGTIFGVRLCWELEGPKGPKGSGRRAQGSGLRAQGSGRRVQGPGIRAQGAGLRAQGSGPRVQGSRLRTQGSRLKAQDSGLRDQASPRQNSLASQDYLHPTPCTPTPCRYLAQKKTPIPLGPLLDPGHRPTVES